MIISNLKINVEELDKIVLVWPFSGMKIGNSYKFQFFNLFINFIAEMDALMEI
jgi:hypothetical protein